MARGGYPPASCRRVLNLVEPGCTITNVARYLRISEQTSYERRRRNRFDRG